MTNRGTWITFCIIVIVLLGSCTGLAAGTQHMPASLLAVVAMLGLKLANDRWKFLRWPMEFILLSAVIMIVFNLVYLYFTDF